jgi:hypothetical protein
VKELGILIVVAATVLKIRVVVVIFTVRKRECTRAGQGSRVIGSSSSAYVCGIHSGVNQAGFEPRIGAGRTLWVHAYSRVGFDSEISKMTDT